MEQQQTLNLESTNAFRKYNNKKVRIMKHVYVISINEWFGQINVELNPVTSGSTASTSINRESYTYEMGGRVFKKAVDFAYDVQNELENDVKVDYLIEVDE